MRNILLLEPNYKNKYPPIGLMKIATYHRMLGDKVTFFKGPLRDLLTGKITNKCIKSLKKLDDSIDWIEYRHIILRYIRSRKKQEYPELVKLVNNDLAKAECLIYYRDFYWKKEYEKDREYKYDRVYVTTLFTFYWKTTVETINFAKKLVKNPEELKVGGVTATILAEDLYKETGIRAFEGLLDKPGLLDDNDIIIDTLPLDYSLLDEIDHKYYELDAYYGNMTRGCIRHCSFCVVPTLESTYKNYIPLANRIKEVDKLYGEKRNLLLFDNNILASSHLKQIVEEIKSLGFYKGATYVEPNPFQIAIRNLRNKVNNQAYTRLSYKLIHQLLEKLTGEEKKKLYKVLEKHKLLIPENVTRKKVLGAANRLSKIYNNNFKRYSKHRYVDFNQGLDVRLINEDNIKLLSELPIYPLRIAFDTMVLKDQYVNAVRLASKYGINNLSNYLLYNEQDHPDELYDRLKINIELSKELDINIYSFPMKYHAINGDDRFNREYLGPHWCRKFVRAVQVVLNATKGKIGRKEDFFLAAFGKNKAEYEKILYMPETYIFFRYFFRDKGITGQWEKEFYALQGEEREEAKAIIRNNIFVNVHTLTTNEKILNLLRHYQLGWEEVDKAELESYYAGKQEFDDFSPRLFEGGVFKGELPFEEEYDSEAI